MSTIVSTMDGVAQIVIVATGPGASGTVSVHDHFFFLPSPFCDIHVE